MNAPIKLPIILMAEDDPDDRLLAKDAVAESNIEADLHFVENGEELLDYLWHRGKFNERSVLPCAARRPSST